ncbi:MAG: hypothetical protein ACTS7D_00440 [Candidatus Hodgkinia cicadicola]
MLFASVSRSMVPSKEVYDHSQVQWKIVSSYHRRCGLLWVKELTYHEGGAALPLNRFMFSSQSR